MLEYLKGTNEGSMNTVTNALRHIHEVNMPSFIEFKLLLINFEVNTLIAVLSKDNWMRTKSSKEGIKITTSSKLASVI